MNFNPIFSILLGLVVVVSLASCEAHGDHTGYEFAPQMYHSVPYEPLTQITYQDAGYGLFKGFGPLEVDDLDDDQGEFYNSNPLNKPLMNSNMTMRTPVEGTVRRTGVMTLPYRLPKDSIDYAARVVKNPWLAEMENPSQPDSLLSEGDSTMMAELRSEGRELYEVFCQSCHGANGQGDGLVGQKFGGVPKYNVGRVADVSEGHIFHTITMGKGRMGAHGSQIAQLDRWKIVMYVQQLQKLPPQ